MSQARPVTFRFGAEELCGIYELPDAAAPRRDTAILLVHAGARGRLGSTFQYPMFARRFAELGYPSLRFDPHGVGDSSGHIPATPMRDFYGSISVGRFVGDTLAGIEELRRVLQPKRVVLFGVCGGAVSALLAAPRSPFVDGLVLLSPPVLIDSAQESELSGIPAEYARTYLLNFYAKKIFSLAAWKRLLTRQSDLGSIWSYGMAALKAPLARLRPKRKGAERKRHPRFNEHLYEAFDAVVKRKGRILFVLGEGDALRWDFQKEFYDAVWQDDPAYGRQCAVHYVPGCNHLFTLLEWQRRALELSTPWLEAL